MDNILKESRARYETEKKQRAFNKIKQAHKIADDKAALVAAIDSLRENAARIKSGNADMADKAAKYAHILDGLFDRYLEQSKDLYHHDDYVAKALKTHQQAIRSLYLWHKLKSD